MEKKGDATVRVIEQYTEGILTRKKHRRDKWFFCALNPDGDSSKFLVGVCRPVFQTLTLFQTIKHVIFHTHFQTRDPFLESPDN